MTIRSRTSGSGASSSSHSVGLPAGVQVGDRLFVGFANDDTTSNPTVPSGPSWTLVGTVQDQGTGTNHSLSVWTRVATGTDSLTVELSAAQEAQWVAICLEGDGGAPQFAFADGPNANAAPVTAITGLTSGNYDSIIFLALDNGGATTHPVTADVGPLAEGWGNLVTPAATTHVVLCRSMDRSATAVTGFAPTASIEWTGTTEQWITAHVVVPQVSAGPVEKLGTDTALGTEAGTSTATLTPAADTALGTEAGTVSPSGGELALGTESGYVSESKLGGDTALGTETGTTSATVTPPADTALGTEAGTTSATVTPGPDTAVGTEAGHIAIPGGEEALGTDAHVPPTLVTVTTGEEALGQEGGYVETLYGDLIVSLFVVHPETSELVALPHLESLDISRERNSKGSVRTQYPINGKDFALLRSSITDSRDLEFELWTNGTSIGALRGYLQEASGDDVVADDNGEDGSWQFAGSFLEVRTDETLVWPQDLGPLITDPDTGELVHTNPRRELIVNADTPGELMTLLLQQAQARGSLTDIVADFTTTHDSNGVPWAGVLTGNFSPGVSYTSILNKMVDFGLIEWAIVWDWENQRKVFKVWNAEGRGADLTLGPRPVTLRRGRNLLDAPHKWSVRDSATTMLAAGAEGLYRDTTDATALARRDRRVEAYTSLNNAVDEEAVLGWAQAQLALVAPGFTSISHGIGMLPGEPRPVIAFDIGDWVYSVTSTVPERLRVVQWTLAIDINRSLSGTVTLNDTVQNAIERLKRRLDAIASGEAVVGTSEPGPQIEDRTPPAAPDGLVASSIAYQDPEMSGGAGGQTLSFVTVGWNVVTTNADGADSPLVQAAVFILDKMEEELANPEVPDPEEEDGGSDYDPIQGDWTWKNCPQIVQDFNDPLLMLWNDDGNPDAMTWLADYIAEASQTPTAAQDVAGYDVRYSYLGLEQVGGIPSSDPFPEDERFYHPATPPEGTSSNQYSFGGVEGGSRLRIEVRAFDRAGNYGAWSEISHDTAVDATPPPVPSPPTGLKTWFRTLDVPWDGLGSEGEPMPIDFSHTRVWVSQGADITMPPEPVAGPTQFDPLETGPQWVANLYAGGTWNVPDLPIGVGYYAALQTIDYTGNASARSAVVGPVTAQQLVGQDLLDGVIDATKLGPNSVDTQHVVNGAITNAQIANATIIAANIGLAQINTAHIQEISAGVISTGTLTATVILGGSFWTSTNPSVNRMGFSAGGLQMFRGVELVGEWKVSDGSMLVTGTYRSGTSGPRIHINPNGTIEMFPTSGTNRSTIRNESGEMVWRGPVDGSQRSGRVNVNILGVGINFSKENDLLENIRAELLVLDRQTRLTAPFHNIQVDERYTNPAGGNRRIQFSWLDSNGDFVSRSGLSYGLDSSDYGGFYGNDTGWKLSRNGDGHGRFTVTDGVLGNYGVAQSDGWEQPSSGSVKEDVEDARAILDPLETIRNARARKFRTVFGDPAEAPKVGVIAEELPEVLHRPMTGASGEPIAGIDLGSQIGVLWGAIGQILDQEIVSTSAVAILQRSQLPPGGIFAAGESREVTVAWESTPPVAPTGGFVQINSAFIWAGKVTAWIKTGSTTETGCVVVFKNISSSTVVVNETVDNLRISATAIGLGLFTPPYVPPED